LSFLVNASQGPLLAGDLALAALADASALNQPAFADHRVGGEDLRVITYPHASRIGAVRIVVAETTRRRDSQAQLVLIDTLVPNVVLMAMALALVRVGVGLGMRPVDQLSRSVRARTEEDLSPLRSDQVPGELLPLVEAINRHMLQLKAAAAAQQAFLSDAAHQLRTPLASVSNQLELAVREVGPTQSPRLEKIRVALQRMSHTTHQMLALARSGPQSAQVDVFERVDLRQMLEDAASQWLDAALAARVDLGFDAQPAWVHGSTWMLNELLGNLIDNALRHSPPGSQVTVRSGVTIAGGAWMSVEDEGPGIALAEREKVLGRFYQAPGAASGGSGLGLAIVHEVAQRHAALVSLDDGPVGHAGQGLRVTIQFPAAPPIRG
jgi:two-component system sensor histidine kinase TctE